MTKNMTRNMAAVIAGTMVLQMTAIPALAASAAEKEETVYVKTDPYGNTSEVIVSDWLKNPRGEKCLSDTSTLQEIENVKGEESFEQQGNQLVWQADGEDIYYQGTTEKELPVSVNIRYYLDGKEISPEELAGKSGHVKICYQYENRRKEGEVYTPFTLLTGMVLPSEHFRNLEVTNGKVISDGEKEIVIGVGMPGLSESLKLSDTEMLRDVEIPESFTVEADVTNFKLTLSMTVVSALNLEDLGLDDVESMDDLKETLDEFTDAAMKLVDGSGDLADGVQTLKDSCQELIDGMNAVDENMGTLADGIGTLNSKKGDLIDGINALAAGIQTLENKKGKLVSGVQALAEGSSSLEKGAKKINRGAAVVAENTKKLLDGTKELASGGMALKQGTEALSAGTGALVEGAASLTLGSRSMEAGLKALAEGNDSQALLAGSSQAAAGAAKLNLSVKAYTEGVDQLAGQLPAYVSQADRYAGLTGQYAAGVSSYVDQVNQILGAMSAPQAAYADPGTSTCQIDEAAVANLQTVLGKLQNVQSVINGAKSKEDLIRLYTSYQQYLGELDSCIQLLNSSINGITRTEAAPVVQTQNQAPGGNAEQMAVLIQAGEDLKVNGQKLTEGGKMLQSYTGSLQAGIQALTTADTGEAGTPGQQIAAGMETLASGTSQVDNGIQKVFSEGIARLKEGAAALASGSEELLQGAKDLNEGAIRLDTGADQALEGAGSLQNGTALLSQGAVSLSQGTGELYSGAGQLKDGLWTLNNGAGVLSSGISQLAKGSSRLQSGASELSDGVEQLADGSSQLKEGTAKLAEGGTKLDDGVSELKDGADDLKEGMEKFNKEGVEKVTDFLDEDVQDMIDRLKKVKEAGENYRSFSDESFDGKGKVKFIIETGAIE